ncbi:CPBP family intramembrane glutamic endopeptidase [Brevibacterium luteolum]|uniref:CPBP family intramembrane glutamic endopeptidase n=1 Tax=Brevibacterium luteolum TaxID=199591 RepID=UPI00223B8DF5|nr:CPBP family intramembrane glutamic endopeptidase [Brevibacterium luteolum]MCT1657659.1 CPBP family intramembrane metalloprotease [Brevibacterium luteolum]
MTIPAAPTAPTPTPDSLTGERLEAAASIPADVIAIGAILLAISTAAVVPFWFGADPILLPVVILTVAWTPALTCFIADRITRSRAAPEAVAGFRSQAGLTTGRPWTGSLAALAVPLSVAAVSTGIGALAGWQPLNIGADALAVLTLLPLAAVLMLVQVTGEEIAWRGYLHTRLTGLGTGTAAGVIAVFWVIWHAPLMLTYLHLGEMSERAVIVTLMNLGLASLTLTALRVLSSSVIPAIIAHTVLNTVFAYIASNLVVAQTSLSGTAFWLTAATGWACWAIAALGLAIAQQRRAHRQPVGQRSF